MLGSTRLNRDGAWQLSKFRCSENAGRGVLSLGGPILLQTLWYWCMSFGHGPLVLQCQLYMDGCFVLKSTLYFKAEDLNTLRTFWESISSCHRTSCLGFITQQWLWMLVLAVNLLQPHKTRCSKQVIRWSHNLPVCHLTKLG